MESTERTLPSAAIADRYGSKRYRKPMIQVARHSRRIIGEADGARPRVGRPSHEKTES
jgi:hypothetical protein